MGLVSNVFNEYRLAGLTGAGGGQDARKIRIRGDPQAEDGDDHAGDSGVRVASIEHVFL